jgi:hypothetical protein
MSMEGASIEHGEKRTTDVRQVGVDTVTDFLHVHLFTSRAQNGAAMSTWQLY